MVSLQKYQALLKTIELGSMSRAAEQIGYTQPAISKMIADLETEWGIELLRRNRSGIEVTSAAKYILPVLKEISANCTELRYYIDELHGNHTGLIRIGAFASIVDSCLPQMIRQFQQDYPQIDFELKVSEEYAEIEDWIIQGRVDCGFVSTPTIHDLQTTFFKRDELIAVLPENHALAGASYFPVSQLAEDPGLILKEEIDVEVAQFLKQLPAPPKPRYRVNGDHTILSMVEAGLGISIVHSLIAESNRYHVVWKPFDSYQYRNLGIAISKSIKTPKIVQLFITNLTNNIYAKCF